MKRYELRHVTTYGYESPVFASYGRAHLKPGDVPGQRCVSTRVQISPEPADTSEHLDYFGNVSTFFCVRTEHTVLTVTAVSELEISRVLPAVAQLNRMTWEQARDDLHAHPALTEFVLPSLRTRPSSEVDAYAAGIFTPGRPLGDAITDLVHRIYTDFEYKFGATTIDTSLGQLLRKRAGVCQDFAHLAIGCLRSVGLAARYVSGYLETQPPPGQVKLQGADASHAWASVRVPGAGWIDLDPTNDQLVDDRYLVTAWGRDYSDVPPLKGVIVTDSRKSTLDVGVDVIRIG